MDHGSILVVTHGKCSEHVDPSLWEEARLVLPDSVRRTSL